MSNSHGSMNGRMVTWLIAGIGLVLAGFYLFGSNRIDADTPIQEKSSQHNSDDRLPSVEAETSKESSDLESEALLSEADAPELPVAIKHSSEREVVTEFDVVLAGIALTETGKPIVGATVSWTAWDSEFLFYVTASKEIPPAAIASNSIYSETNEKGEFIFGELPALAPGAISYVWITHPEFSATVMEVGTEHIDEGFLGEIILPLASRFSAVVVSGERPVEGADVHQQVAFPVGSPAPYENGKRAPKDLLTFLRSFSSDEYGQVELAPISETVHVAARLGGRVSRPWIGIPKSSIELSLQSTFALSGQLEIPSDLKENFGTPLVLVERVRGASRQVIGTLAVEEDGAFGPEELPILDAEFYSLKLGGGMLQAGDVRIPVPKPGEDVSVYLKGVIGSAVWYMAITEAEDPIPFPFLDLRWEEDGIWHEQHVKGREDGYVVFTSCPETTLYGTIGADGYGLAKLVPNEIPEIVPLAARRTLLPAHRVSGVCMQGDVPATDFEVRFWALGDSEHRGRLIVTDSETGEFTIENLPSPSVSLMAISFDYERSEELVLDLSSGSDAGEVILNLEAGIQLTGQVVDVGTKDPIPGALVTVYTNEGYRELDPIGPPIPTDSNGDFSTERLGSGLNIISISAPGYSTRGIKVKGDPSESSGLGVIELGAEQPLTVQLLAPEGADPTEFILTATGIGSIGTERFDSQGFVRVENANAGSYFFEVRHTNGGLAPEAIQLHWLKPGDSWDLVFQYTEGRALLLTTSGAKETCEELYARVQFSGLDGTTNFQSQYFDVGSELNLSGGIGVGPMIISVYSVDGSESLAGSISYEVSDEDSETVELHVDLHEGRASVRVVDSEFKPMSGVTVRVRLEGPEAVYIAHQFTGAGGEAVFLGLPEGNYRLDMTSSAAAQMYDVEYKITGHEIAPFEVVFDTGSAVKIKVVDEGIPQQLIDCRLWALEGDICLTSSQTPDEEGIVNIKDLGEGNYDLRLDGPHHWPVSRIVEARTDDHFHTIEVRQLAGVALKFVNAEGISFSGENVELDCLSMGEKASNWIASGKLASENGWLATNQEGLLSLPKLPHGKYRWSIAGATGTFDLAPGELLEKRIVIP
ncbi:MAG: hypothetical protein ACI8X5_003172 [Planctomycetota bacterium]